MSRQRQEIFGERSRENQFPTPAGNTLRNYRILRFRRMTAANKSFRSRAHQLLVDCLPIASEVYVVIEINTSRCFAALGKLPSFPGAS